MPEGILELAKQWGPVWALVAVLLWFLGRTVLKYIVLLEKTLQDRERTRIALEKMASAIKEVIRLLRDLER